MDPRLMRLTGTSLEVFGTFFLAVEAIKLHNLRSLREKVLKVAALKVNPMISFVDPKSEEEERQAQAGELWLNLFIVSFTLLGVLISYALLCLTGFSLAQIWLGFSHLIPGPAWIDIAVALPTFLVFLLIASVVGFSAYTLVVLFIDFLIRVLEFIERHTETGIVGILGFLSFFIGATLKAYLDWRGA